MLLQSFLGIIAWSITFTDCESRERIQLELVESDLVITETNLTFTTRQLRENRRYRVDISTLDNQQLYTTKISE